MIEKQEHDDCKAGARIVLLADAINRQALVSTHNKATNINPSYRTRPLSIGMCG